MDSATSLPTSEFGNFSRIDIRPGDKFVLFAPFALSSDAVERIRTAWREFAGDVPIMILDNGMSLGVISAGDVA